MELGSEYNLNLSGMVISDNNLFSYLSGYDSACYLDSGRSAIRCVSSRLNEDDGVLLPEYICESVIRCFSRKNISFYKISEHMAIEYEDLANKINNKTRIIFIAHYYGAVQNREVLDRIRQLADTKGCVIIEDVTHSLFSSDYFMGDYVISSIRKWMPVPHGGLLLALKDRLGVLPLYSEPSRDNERVYGMILKDMFLDEKLDCNKEYREIFRRCEDRIDEQTEVKGASDLTRFIIECTDVEELIDCRKANYNHLKDMLEPMGLGPVLEIKEGDCPFAYPIRIPNRDVFRNYLTDNKVYCAVHWPRDGIMEDMRNQAVRNSEELLSLPIDQRYSEGHMDYLAEVIKGYRGDLSF